MSSRSRVFQCVLVASLTAALHSTKVAQAQEETLARIPVRVVAGRLVVFCDLSTAARRIPANLVIDFENPCRLQLHNRAAMALRAESRSGKTQPITIHFSRFKVTVPKREHGPEDFYNDFTKWYSHELGENAVVGTIGARLLKDYHVTIDVKAGYLFLDKPRKEDAEDKPRPEGTIELPVSISNDIVWLPVRLPDGKPTAMAIGTGRFDSTIDSDVCDDLNHSAGDIGMVRLGSKDVSKYVALRPEEITYTNKDGALGVLGLNFWKHFRVEVDRVHRKVFLTETAEPKFPSQDLAFFRAMVDEEIDGLDNYLKKHPKSRLSEEAAQLMIKWCMEEDAGTEVFTKAVRWVDQTSRTDLRCSKMLELMKELEEGGYPKAAISAGKTGVPSARKDRYPEAIHKVHSNLGRLLLDGNQDKQAWRHLLAAAFGLPQDGMINLQLGRFYEKQKRYSRATSRYVQAVIAAESGPQAMAGLQRVHKATGGKDRMSVDIIERLIAGKTYNFSAADRFQPDKDSQTNRVVLVEFFTNGHLKVPGIDAGAVGGALGNEGAMTHFPRSRVAMLGYHLPAPELEPLTNAVSMNAANTYGVQSPVVQMINGLRQAPGAGKARDGEKIYTLLKSQIESELRRASAYKLAIKAEVTNKGVSGELTVTGPEADNVSVHLVLAERGVLFPGRSKVVIHRMVARSVLTETLKGEVYAPKAGQMKVDFDKSFAAVRAENERFLDQLEQRGAGVAQKFATDIDPAQVTIVGFVRDKRSNEILQAIQFTPRQETP